MAAAFSVSDARTFKLRRGLSGIVSDHIVTLNAGDDVTLAVDYTRVLNKGTALASVSAPTETSGASPAPLLDAQAMSEDRKKALFDVTTITANLSYTVEVTVTTSDGQTIIVDVRVDGV